MIDNSEAYFALSWILDEADRGFYAVVAPSHMQIEIANRYKSQRIGIYDYSQNPRRYSYATLNTWVQSQPESVDVYFVLNMQIAFRDESSMAAINFDRDALARTKKIWIFFMDMDLENRLLGFAYDFCSFIRQRVRFESEHDEDFEGRGLLKFDGRYNFGKIKGQLKRYSEMEERYMALPLEGTPRNQLLSAALALVGIAELYRDCGEYENALRILEKIRKIREHELGTEHPDTCKNYNDTAMIYFDQTDYNKALEWYRKALKISSEVMGSNHRYIATYSNNIALTYNELGDYTTALEWYQKALDIQEKALGTKHPYIATTYNNIAIAHYNLEEYATALEWYQRAIDIIENTPEAEPPNIVTAYSNISRVYRKQKNYTKALECSQKALTIGEEVLGEEHPTTAYTYYGMGAIYVSQGDRLTARKWFLKAYDSLSQSLGEDHPDTKRVKSDLEILA